MASRDKSKSWEFKFKFNNNLQYDEYINNIIQTKNIKTYFTYKRIDRNVVVGYVILQYSTTLHYLLKINCSIEWKKTTAKNIESLNMSNLINYPNSKKTLEDEVNELLEENNQLKEEITNLNEKYNKLKEEIIKKELIDKCNNYEKEIKKLKKEKEKSTSNTINIQNNVQNINITINSYKQPNVEHLTNRDYKRFLDCYELNGITNLLQVIYFNPLIKENHNMFIPNNRYTDIVVFENNNWVIKNRDIVVGELCHTCSNNIMSWYDLVSDEEQTDISVKYLSNVEKEKYKDITELKTDQLIDDTIVNKYRESILNLIKSNKDLGKMNNKLFELKTR